MTLIDDLHSLDLSAVVDAKDTIDATVDAGALRAVLDAGPISVLGDVGASTGRLRAVVVQPDTLVADALAGITGIVDGLGRLELPIVDLVEAVPRRGGPPRRPLPRPGHRSARDSRGSPAGRSATR